MIVHNTFDYIFNTQGNIAVLRILNERVEGISGREVARLANISVRAAQMALLRLESLGLVKRNIGGRDHLFILNRNNYFSDFIIPEIFKVESNFRNEIISSIKKKLGKYSLSIILFGSCARKEEEINSDFDICIIYKKDKKEIDSIVSSLRDELWKRYSIHFAPFFITESEFKKRASFSKPPVNEIIKDGILITGKSIKELLRG